MRDPRGAMDDVQKARTVRISRQLQACLIGAFSLSAQAQGAGYAPPHVDTSGKNQQPPYPPAAVANGEQGTVVVGVAVTENGKAVRPSLDRSSGFNDLDNAALAAVLNWKYVPAMHDGVPVEERLEVGVNFQLPDMPVDESAGFNILSLTEASYKHRQPTHIGALARTLSMRPEIERTVEEIKQAVALLRRHL